MFTSDGSKNFNNKPFEFKDNVNVSAQTLESLKICKSRTKCMAIQTLSDSI